MPPQTGKRPQDGKHRVKDGEWVGKIALMYGFTDWEQDVWMHPENEALRTKRKDPHVLAEGDELYIPPFEEKQESGGTEAHHRFRLPTPTECLRIQLLDAEGEPFADEPYTLELDYEPGAAPYKQQHETTDGDGFVEEMIPSSATGGRLCLTRLNQTIELDLGYLTPMDLDDKPKLIRGAQERLLAVGFDPGPVDGIDGPMTQTAVAAFQQFCADHKDDGDPRITDSGPVDGIVGPKTRDALLTYYGC